MPEDNKMIVDIPNSISDKVNTDMPVDLHTINENVLAEVRAQSFPDKDNFKIPISELATLGAGVSELVPAFHTITQTMTTNATGLYRIVNAGVGDVLKAAKDGTNWGALKNTATGKSTMAKLQEVGTQTVTNTTVVPPNPAIIMMAVTLYQIEHKLDEIKEIQKQIVSFLENEKASEIEADVQVLNDVITRLKFSWDNQLFIAAHYKTIIEIKNRAQANINFYRKQLVELFNKKSGVMVKAKVEEELAAIQKNFTYYRLSLYLFAEASFLDIMLSGNFREENFNHVKEEIRRQAGYYSNAYDAIETLLKRHSRKTIGTLARKGAAAAEGGVGVAINHIPLLKNTIVGDVVEGAGEIHKYRATKLERDIIKDFSSMKDPRVNMFIEKINDMIQIYHHSSNIYIDKNNIYLAYNEK